MRYSVHALERLENRRFSKRDVEAVLANPVRGVYESQTRDRREHFGYTADGRVLNVITDKSMTIVISVVEQ